MTFVEDAVLAILTLSIIVTIIFSYVIGDIRTTLQRIEARLYDN